MNDDPGNIDIDGIYLDMELFDLTAQRTIEPRDRVRPIGRPFPGLGISAALDAEPTEDA